MSVYGRAVCKLNVLSSHGKKNRVKQQEIYSYHTGEHQVHAGTACDSDQFGTDVPTFRRHLQLSPPRYREEGSSIFSLTPPTCLHCS